MVAGGGVTVTLSGSNLKANGSTVTLTPPPWSPGPPAAAAAVTSSTGAQTSRGRTISHSGNYTTAGWDGSCLTLNGSFTTQIGLFGWSTIANYKRCRECAPPPELWVITAGANSATVTFANSATVDLHGQ